MAKKSSIEARLSLTTDGWKKGLDDAAKATEQFKRRAEAAMAFNAGGPAQSRSGLEQRLKLEGMGLQPMGGTSITGIKMRPRAMETPFEDPAYVSRLKKQMEGVNGEMDRLRSSGNNGGRGLLELSRGFEDAQYGISGVLNNIPSIVESLGGTAGLAGAASIAAVALSLFGDELDEMWKKASGAELDALFKKRAEARMDEFQQELEHIGTLRKLEQERAEGNARYMQELTVSRVKSDADSFAHRMRLLDVENQIQRAAVQQLEEKERIVKMQELEQRQAQEKIRLEQQFASEQADRAKRAADYSAQELSRLEDQRRLWMEQSSVRDTNAADLQSELQKAEEKAAAIRGQPGSETMTRLMEQAAAEKEVQAIRQRIRDMEQEKARGPALDAEIAQVKQTADVDKSIAKDAAAQVEEAKRAAELQDKVNKLNKANADRTLKELEKNEALKLAKDINEMFGQIGGVVGDFGKAAELAQQNAKRLQEEARRLQETREDAGVDHLRRRGLGAAADRRERKLTEKRRAAELEAEGMSPEEAKAQAAQERVDSRRGIRGAPARQFEGIDAFRRGSMTKPDFPALDNRRAPSASSRRVPAADADARKAASPEAAATKESADRVVAAIDTLRTTLQPPVADKLKAA